MNGVDTFVGETVEEPEVDVRLPPDVGQHPAEVYTEETKSVPGGEARPVSYGSSTRLLLDPDGVRKVRLEEIDYMRTLHVWEPRSLSECYERTGRPHIGTWWTELNKGDDVNPVVRCRLVVQETKYRTTLGPTDISATFQRRQR